MLPQLWGQAPCLESGLSLEESSDPKIKKSQASAEPEAGRQQGGVEPKASGESANSKEEAKDPQA